MQPIPLVRSSSIRPLLEFVSHGGSRMRAMQERVLPAHGSEMLLPVAYAGALYEEAARRSGVEDLGYRLADITPVERFGEWYAVVGRSPTPARFLETAISTHHRFNNGYRMWTVVRGDELTLHLRYSRALRAGRRQVLEFAARMVLAMLRDLLGPTWRPLELHFEGDPPRHAEELAALATRAVRFGQPGLAFVFPRRCLAQRRAPLARLPALRADGPAPATEFADSARQLVGSLVRLGIAELASAAEAAGTSERTLQRHLGRVGLRFSELVEEARFEAACHLLADPARRVIDVSSALGYRDSANFTRAFRRWSGVSPQLFRSTHP